MKAFDARKSMKKMKLKWDRIDILPDGSLGKIHHMEQK